MEQSRVAMAVLELWQRCVPITEACSTRAHCLPMFLLWAGITMTSASTRKKPNAFNLLWQLKLLRDAAAHFEEAGLPVELA